MTKDYWDAPPFRQGEPGDDTDRSRRTTADVANAVYFLASAQGSYINGQTLALDGGWSTTRFLTNEGIELVTADGDLDPVVDRSYLICRYRLLRRRFIARPVARSKRAHDGYLIQPLDMRPHSSFSCACEQMFDTAYSRSLLLQTRTDTPLTSTVFLGSRRQLRNIQYAGECAAHGLLCQRAALNATVVALCPASSGPSPCTCRPPARSGGRGFPDSRPASCRAWRWPRALPAAAKRLSVS